MRSDHQVALSACRQSKFRVPRPGPRVRLTVSSWPARGAGSRRSAPSLRRDVWLPVWHVDVRRSAKCHERNRKLSRGNTAHSQSINRIVGVRSAACGLYISIVAVQADD